MEEGTDVDSHVIEFQCLVRELEFLGEMNLDEEDQARLLLKSLPQSFEPVKRILSTVEAEKLTIDNVRDEMVVRDYKLQMKRFGKNKSDQTREPSRNTKESCTGYGIDRIENPIVPPVFCQWKSQIESLLALHGCYDILQSIEQKPESMTEHEWSRLDAKALFIILDVTPKLWFQALLDKLEKRYKSSKWDKLLWMKLRNLKMKKGSNVHDHIGEFQWLVNELKFLDKMHLDEKGQANLLLESLPRSFDPLKVRLPEVGHELTMDYVRTRIVGADLRMKLRRKLDNRDVCGTS